MAQPEPDWDEKTEIEVEAGKVVSVTRTQKVAADTQPGRDLRPVNSLVLLPDNPRHGDIGALTESLARFGQQKPIVINPDGVILAGNHTFQAAVALGWEQIWVNESSLEGSDQPAFALADNRLSDLATYNNDALLKMIEEAETLDGTGYDWDDVDTLKRITETYGIDAPLDPYSAWGDMPPYKNRDMQSEFTITVHFLTMKDADQFFELIDRRKTRVVYWPEHDGFVGDTVVTQHWVNEE